MLLYSTSPESPVPWLEKARIIVPTTCPGEGKGIGSCTYTKYLEVKPWKYKEAISQKEYTFTTIFEI
jgi:hypothetical protein